MKITNKLPDGVLWEKAKEYSKQFAIKDKPVQSEIAMNDAQDHYYRGMIALRDMIEQRISGNGCCYISVAEKHKTKLPSNPR